MALDVGRAGVVAGAGVPHAPQFWSMPDTEDPAEVARVREAMATVGERLQELDPDVVILVSNDHSENFYRACVPPFVLHCGQQPGGTFGQRSYSHRGLGERAFDVVTALQDQGFDPAFSAHATISYAFGIPLEFCQISPDLPVLPIFVNAYFPPQPSPERCFALGQALDRACRRLGIRAVALASGGFSHYPGTDRYSEPDVETDREMLQALTEGRPRALLGYDLDDLDRTGNTELLPWLILAGALGQRRPDLVELVPCWHHTYTVVGWTGDVRDEEAPARRYYPSTAPLEGLSAALHAVRWDHEGATGRFVASPASVAEAFGVEARARTAFVDLDEAELLRLGAHPILLTGALRSVRARRAS